MVRLMAVCCLLASVVPVSAEQVVAHYEYECLDPDGCLQTARVGDLVSYELEIYPDMAEFGTYVTGDVVDFTSASPSFLSDFLTSGSLAEPEPAVFAAHLVGVGGSGVGLTKADWQSGESFLGPRHRFEAGYDVPLLNGIDLQGYDVTAVRFELYELEVLPSNVLAGSALKTHFRYEILGTLVPEPHGLGLVAAAVSLLMWQRGRPVSRSCPGRVRDF